MRVLVISALPALEGLLAEELPQGEFEIFGVRPGAALVAAARAVRPEIAVIDEAGRRREAALLEIALLRDLCPDVRLIALSPSPSLEDAALVEAGLFYYLCASPPARLPDLVRAAARALRSGHAAKGDPTGDAVEPAR